MIDIPVTEHLAGLLVMKMSGSRMTVHGLGHQYTLHLVLSLVSIVNKVHLGIPNRSQYIVLEPLKRQLKRLLMNAFPDKSITASMLTNHATANLLMKDKWNTSRSPIPKEILSFADHSDGILSLFMQPMKILPLLVKLYMKLVLQSHDLTRLTTRNTTLDTLLHRLLRQYGR